MYNKISSDFPHEIYFLEDFDNLPTFPGIYSWHLYCAPDNFSDFHKFYKSKSYRATIKGFLKEEFQGDLECQTLEFDSIVNEESLFKLASSLFSPPLYVGITTRTLRMRLREHKNSIIKSINDIDHRFADEEITEEIIDTEFEAKVLGDRIAKSLSLLSDKFNESNLFVKTISITRNYHADSLKGIETILNRTFNPILGRR